MTLRRKKSWQGLVLQRITSPLMLSILVLIMAITICQGTWVAHRAETPLIDPKLNQATVSWLRTNRSGHWAGIKTYWAHSQTSPRMKNNCKLLQRASIRARPSSSGTIGTRRASRPKAWWIASVRSVNSELTSRSWWLCPAKNRPTSMKTV